MVAMPSYTEAVMTEKTDEDWIPIRDVEILSRETLNRK
jgi:hypothetical protein